MTEIDGTAPPPYHLSYTGFARSALQRLVDRAGQLGLRAELLAAVRGLEQSLRTRPLDLGEPIRDLKDMGLQERYGNHSFVFARFAVDGERRLVYVMDFTAVGHGF